MNAPREIQLDLVMSNALSMVKNAKQEILATMDLAEELARPLPEEYFSLLTEKFSEGVRVVRLAFGSEKDFQEFIIRRPEQASYSVLSPSQDYRRMLLVDHTTLMYAIPNGDGRKFFRTDDPTTIKKFVDYFSMNRPKV